MHRAPTAFRTIPSSSPARTLAAACLLATSIAHAGPTVELETDPVALFLRGGSGHVALAFDHVRLNLGVFGARVPKFFHGNDGWTQSTLGMSAKFDYFGSDVRGLFAGLELNVTRNRYTLDETGQHVMGADVAVGPRIGYRFAVTDHLYITPWVGVSYSVYQDAVAVDGRAFETSRFGFFPTVHLGYRF